MASLYVGVFVRKMSPFVIFTNQTMIFTDRDFFLTNDYFNKLPYVYYRFSSDFSLWGIYIFSSQYFCEIFTNRTRKIKKFLRPVRK